MLPSRTRSWWENDDQSSLASVTLTLSSSQKLREPSARNPNSAASATSAIRSPRVSIRRKASPGRRGCACVVISGCRDEAPLEGLADRAPIVPRLDRLPAAFGERTAEVVVGQQPLDRRCELGRLVGDEQV